MHKRLKGFAVSWFFAPYLGSADLDFFKRIKNCDIHFDVVQVKREKKDERVLKFVGDATLSRYEVETDHQNPRTRKTRDDFRKNALAIFQRNRGSYDFIISHSNEVPSHAVALECKRLAPELPWIAYFGDVVSTNPYVKLLASYPLHDEDCKTEALTLEHADVIVCNNEYQRRLMFSGPMEPFAHKAVVVPHCYDRAMFPTTKLARNDRFTFMHVGTLYHTRRTAAPLLKGIDRLLEIYPRYEHRFEVAFYGGGYYQEDLVAHSSMRFRSHARLEGHVGYLDSLQLMRSADVLVNIDGIFTKEADGLDMNPFFPGKLTDYMGAQKPIMGITMPVGPTADILNASGNLLADSRIDRIAYVLKRYLDRKVQVSDAPFARYDVAFVGKEMEAVITAASQGRSALLALPEVLLKQRAALPQATVQGDLPALPSPQVTERDVTVRNVSSKAPPKDTKDTKDAKEPGKVASRRLSARQLSGRTVAKGQAKARRASR